MPEKFELAAYLVNLQSLMSSQYATHANPSETLAAEYNRGWERLKGIITKEQQQKEKSSGQHL